MIFQWMKRPSTQVDSYYTCTLVVSLKKLFWLSDISAFPTPGNVCIVGCGYKTDSFKGSSLTIIQDGHTDNYGYTIVVGI